MRIRATLVAYAGLKGKLSTFSVSHGQCETFVAESRANKTDLAQIFLNIFIMCTFHLIVYRYIEGIR